MFITYGLHTARQPLRQALNKSVDGILTVRSPLQNPQQMWHTCTGLFLAAREIPSISPDKAVRHLASGIWSS